MRIHSTSHVVAVAALLAAGAQSWAVEAEDSIAVEIRDYARVAPATLAAATHEAARVLRRAGIEVHWSLGPPPGGETTAGAGPREAVALEVTILAPRHASPVRSRSVLGYAILPADGSPGDCAGVRFGAVERQLHETTASLPQILGYVIAHEVAHLLLGTNAHAQWGVMSAQVSGAYFDRAAQGTLLFTPDEAERLRAGIRSRIAVTRQLAGVD